MTEPHDSGLIIVRLTGGLGNQMFQYAAGLAVAGRLRARLCVDTSNLTPAMSHYGFELPRVFQRSFPVASTDAVRQVLGWRFPLRGLLSRRSLAALPLGPLLIEPHFEYWPAIERVRRSCYLVGYWQSEQYFGAIAPAVRDAFTFVPPNAGNRAIAAQIADRQSVSLHVRRGDYVSNAKISEFHGLCSKEYYEAAVKLVRSKVRDPRFFVFSDDLDWCRRNLELGDEAVFVDVNRGDDSYNDMWLMSLCNHHIIANSTFSWWGAWLDGRADRITIAPRRWFAAERENTSTIYPADWVRV